MKSIDEIVDPNNLLRFTNLKDLEGSDMSGPEVTNSILRFPESKTRGGANYMNALWANALYLSGRVSRGSIKDLAVPATFFCEETGVDLIHAMDLKDDSGNPIVEEREFPANDLYVPVPKLHVFFPEINQDDLLQSLAIKYSVSGDRETAEQLYEKAKPIMGSVIGKMFIHYNKHFPLDELESVANLGFMKSIRLYDPSRGNASFESYLRVRVRGEIIDSIRSDDIVPRSVRVNQRKLRDFKERYLEENGKNPTESDCEDFWRNSGYDMDKLAEAIGVFGGKMQFVSLEGLSSKPDDENLSFIDTIEDPQAIPANRHLEIREIGDSIRRDYEKLTGNEREVARMYFFEGLTLKEIGEEMDVTESRVCQILGKIGEERFVRTRKDFGIEKKVHKLKLGK